MTVRHEISQRMSQFSLRDIAVAMGYSRQKIQNATARINAATTDEYLGLTSSGYDFKYSNEEFLVTLCDVLDIDAAAVAAEISSIWDTREKVRRDYQSWIFVETGFRRTNQSIITLIGTGSLRRIRVAKQISILDSEDQIPRIRELILQHFECTSGVLPVWGQILEYVYVYAEGQQLRFDVNARVKSTGELLVNSAFSIPLNGGGEPR